MAENEMKRRMMMESAINLEVDLSSLGLDEKPEVSICRTWCHHGIKITDYSHQKNLKRNSMSLFGIAA
jgi:hypothetical protein